MKNVIVQQEIVNRRQSFADRYIKNLPVSFFTTVMGTGGLSIAYQRFADIFYIPVISLALLAAAYILFIGISLAYGYKLLRYTPDVVAEFNEPVKANYFAAFSISLLVLGTATFDFQRSVSFVLWCAGAVLQLILILVMASRWIMRDHEVSQTNPAWFLPAAGNILVPIIGVEFAPKEVCWFFFSIGLFFWLVLFVIIFNRITFHPRLSDKLVPTLFIMIAPPALGFIAYVRLYDSFDIFASLLLNIALFLILLLLFMLPYFLKIRFSISWWAYTFPLCIAATAGAIAYRMSGKTGYAWISAILLILASLAVAIVFIKTAVAIKQKTIFEE